MAGCCAPVFAYLKREGRQPLQPSHCFKEYLAWSGMVWHGLAWPGMVWPSMVWSGMAWPSIVWHGMAEAFCLWAKGFLRIWRQNPAAKSGGKICRSSRQWRIFGVFCAAAFAAPLQSSFYRKNNMLICLYNSQLARAVHSTGQAKGAFCVFANQPQLGRKK